MAKENGVDLLRIKPCFLNSLARCLDDQLLEILFQPTELGVATADDADCVRHDDLLHSYPR